MSFRSASLWFHRYTGLVMALFLILTSLTGVFLTFHESLDDWFNRHYLSVEARPNQSKLPITALHHSVQTHYPQAKFSTLPLTNEASDRAVVFRVDRERGKPKDKPSVEFQTVYVNPYSAEITDARDSNEWAWRNTMNKVFWFHRNLLLGEVGKWLLGIVALLWTINCFIGVYLTLPRAVNSKKKGKRKRASAFKRWLPAWKIRRTKNIFKLSFDAHHALSLWLWVMMFVLAWSSVGFNLQPVYRPVMAMIFPQPDNQSQAKKLQASTKSVNNTTKVEKESPQGSQEGSSLQRPLSTDDTTEPSSDANTDLLTPRKPIKETSASDLSMTQIEAAKKVALQLADAKGVQVVEFTSFHIDRKSGDHSIRFKTNLDTVGRGSTITFTSGLKGDDPFNEKNLKSKWGFERSTRDSVSMWLVFLHRGFVWGVPYKIFLALVGLATAIVSGTGVYLWWRGRKTRLKIKAKNHTKHYDKGKLKNEAK